ncbi:MAG: hypothetical protein COA91_09135 [Robiginitomaculum sp.]|nr:MAG: hypothetical protein COA91_09135 [Robiginitomaculum sp.]
MAYIDTTAVGFADFGYGLIEERVLGDFCELEFYALDVCNRGFEAKGVNGELKMVVISSRAASLIL